MYGIFNDVALILFEILYFVFYIRPVYHLHFYIFAIYFVCFFCFSNRRSAFLCDKIYYYLLMFETNDCLTDFVFYLFISRRN